MAERDGPVLIELQDEAPVAPDAAPPVPEPDGARPGGRAMRQAVSLAAGRGPALGRWFRRLLLALAGLGLSLWAWDWLGGLLARSPVLGVVALALSGALLLVCLALALREWAAYARLRRLDAIRRAADAAVAGNDLAAARRVGQALARLYRGREDTAWALARYRERAGEILDADGLLGHAEAMLMAPLDAAARAEIESAARQVAAVTALVPLALADVAAALAVNMRMIRRIAGIYGGRSGTLGSWRLTRLVMAHLLATGAVAVGDDLIGAVAGGGLLSRLSRRFGEGVVNGALTARVGLAAMEICRPLPFMQMQRPGVTALVRQALAGLFADGRPDDAPPRRPERYGRGRGLRSHAPVPGPMARPGSQFRGLVCSRLQARSFFCPQILIWWHDGLGEHGHGQSRVSAAPPTISSAASAFPRLILSPKASQPIATANRIEVSRKPATRATGALVMAQTTIE